MFVKKKGSHSPSTGVLLGLDAQVAVGDEGVWADAVLLTDGAACLLRIHQVVPDA